MDRCLVLPFCWSRGGEGDERRRFENYGRLVMVRGKGIFHILSFKKLLVKERRQKREGESSSSSTTRCFDGTTDT